MKPAPSFPPLPAIAAPHRFRLGVPSYVYPADILPNVEALAPCVDDIEIVLFESNALNPLPSAQTIVQLCELATEHDLTYTIHLPIDRKLGSPDRAERIAQQKEILKIMALTGPLNPFAYILHLEGVEPSTDIASLKTWQENIAALLPALVNQAQDPSRICVENLFYPFGWCDPLLERFGLGSCLDTGHLALAGGDLDRHFRRYADRIRVIHLHGSKDGKDHLPLTVMPDAWLGRFLNSIDNFTGVLTLELFDFEALCLSMEKLSQGLARCGCKLK